MFLFISIGIGCASAQRLVVVHENGRDLRARGAALRSEVRDAVFTDAGDQAVADGPRHRRARPRRDAARIREAGERARLRQALGRKLLGIVIEDDRKLRARRSQPS